VRALPRGVQVTPAGDSTWVLSAGTANVVACLTGEGWVLADTGTRIEAAAIREEVRRIAQRPFALVIDTHFHDDHAGGNALYVGMGVPVIATPATSALIKGRVARIRAGAPKEIARLEAYGKTLGDDQERTRGFLAFFADWWREALDDVGRDPHGVALPTQTLATPTVRKVIGGTPVEIRTVKGRAHTGGDCVVLFPDRKVAACGDVFAKGSAPWADQFMGDGSIDGVLAAQDSLLGWLPDSTWTLVPGHGPAARVADLARDRKALGTLRACVRQAWQAGRKAAAIAEDCAGAGFAASQGDYASWLFLEEWNRGKSRGKAH
jgi:glyoxylase-like metal-dependent hydrolase (beta-lactamase superfamily II)